MTFKRQRKAIFNDPCLLHMSASPPEIILFVFLGLLVGSVAYGNCLDHVNGWFH